MTVCREHKTDAFSETQFGKHPAVMSRGPVPYTALGMWLTRCTPVLHVAFTRSNLMVAGGPRVPLAAALGSVES